MIGNATEFRLSARMEWSIVLTAVLFVVGLAAAAAWAGKGQALTALHALPLSILPVLLAMSALNYIMRAGRWLLFSHAMRLPVPAPANALIYVAGFALTTTPGKVGEALRLWLLKTGYGARYDRTATLLIADRLADAVATCFLIALSVSWLQSYVVVSAIAVIVVGAIAALCLRPSFLLAGVDTLYAGVGRFPRVFVRIKRVIRQLEFFASPRVFGAATVMGVVGWSAEGLSLFVLLHALGIGISPMACIFIFSFGMIVGAISVLPGGLGSTEATMIGLLSLQHVPLDTAIVATAVVRVTTLWFAVGLGLLALPLALRLVRSTRRVFFFEKKKQKTVANLYSSEATIRSNDQCK
jgi:uncharacterized protein (TIRG00374 family)